ncbi:MAG: hypothetical protein HC813_03145 [Planctomycetes bacterium]|nr:hypothetical protein [Planctomycetota bacterium]
MNIALMVWAFVLLFAGLGRFLRSLLAPTLQRSWLARVLVPASLGLFSVLPILYDSLLGAGVRRWHYGHLLNVFWTTAQYSRPGAPSGPLATLLAIAIFGIVLSIPSMVLGLREVLKASEERRVRAPECAAAAAACGRMPPRATPSSSCSPPRRKSPTN